jgi:uncharacterized protein YigA (DUF484 family)
VFIRSYPRQKAFAFLENVMNEPTDKETLTATEVASYLRRHPAFLNEFPDLALALVLPREHGQTASLASYQLDVLRDKNRELARRLRELIETAHENETLMVRVHALTLTLMRARTLAETATAIAAALSEDFGAAFVRLVLFRTDPNLPAADWLLIEPAGAGAFPVFAEFFKRAEPLCGRLQTEKLDILFAGKAAQVHSTALLPLGALGMLAIGSPDANRFHPGVGTVFLKLIGDAATAALARF